MFRLGLVISLMLATLAGPTVCCCAVRASVAAADGAATACDLEPASCCAHREADSRGSDEPGGAPCRCRDREKPPATIQSLGPNLGASPGASWSLHDAALLPYHPCHPESALVLDEQVLTDGGVAFPHLSGRDILRALQTLRC